MHEIVYPPAEPGITVREVSKKFHKIQALNGVTTSIHKGSIFGLIGSNGAGKSTLLRLLAGVYRPDGGEILVDGEPVYENESVKQRIFYLSDDPYYFSNSDMEEMARYFAVIYPRFSFERFHHLAEMLRLDTRRKLNTFSKGMQRQAHIILALACRPVYLFCDETFDGLDPVMRQAVKRILADLVAEEELTPVIASHNLRELEDICDHIGLLHQGGVIFERELDSLSQGIQKVQCAFAKPHPQEAFADLDVVTCRQQGSLSVLVVRGEAETVEQRIQAMHPLFCELLPLTLEEVFLTEMEVRGYDVQQLIY